MAGEIVTTAVTTSYQVQSGDEVYIAPTGSITMNAGSNHALYATTNVASVSVWVDGRIIATEGTLAAPAAILLSSGGASIISGFDIGVGAGGLVRSLNENAIDLTGFLIQVRNEGSVSGAVSGIDIVGDSAEILNSGHASGRNDSGIKVAGLNAFVTNSGDVSGETGVFLNGTGRIGNSGLVVGTEIGLRLDTDGISSVSNTGLIEGGFTALLVFTGGSETVSISNSGKIASGSQGIAESGAGSLDVFNATGGVISGGEREGIRSAGLLTLVNMGTVSSTSGNGIWLGAEAAFSSITNHGTIASARDDAIDASALVAGGGVFLINHGVVAGAYIGAGLIDTVRNFGRMDGVSTANGNDTLRNAGLIDGFVLLGAGNDAYRGAGGTVEGSADGGTGNDTLTGGAGDDDLRGGTDSDLLTGRAGGDTLTGGLGGDALDGGTGEDLLLGGTDKDRLTGGADADIFRFASAAEAGLGATADVLLDFERLVDVIDVSAFMSGAVFVGNAAFTGTAREIRYVKSTGVLEGDADGNGTADWSLVLDNRPTFTAADLVL